MKIPNPSVFVLCCATLSFCLGIAEAFPQLNSISGSSPTSGGGQLTLTGTGFGASGAVVNIGGNVASVVAQDANQITCSAPPGEGTLQPVTVTLGMDTSVEPIFFSYDAPMIASLSPARGLASDETTVTIFGTSFGLNPTVTFGAGAGIVIGNNHNQITVTKPVDSGGNLNVVVTVSGQTSNTKLFRSVALTSLPGYFVDLDLEQVVPAPAGKYTPDANMSEPLAAPAGTYTPVAGMQATIPASKGYYIPLEGSASQTPAPAGSLTTTEGASVLEEAPKGSYTPVEGMQAAVLASKGYYVDLAGRPTQTPAPAGRFTATVGSVTAEEAPAGTYVPLEGMSAAIPADPGFYVASSGSSSQTPADPGKYVSISGAQGAIDAPLGTYAPIAGCRQPIPAPAGTYVSIAGAIAVQTVPAGSTSIGEGATEITPIVSPKITDYQLEANGDNTVDFETVSGQNYGIFYTENLLDFVRLETIAGTGSVISRTFTPPVSVTSKRFYVVSPVATP